LLSLARLPAGCGRIYLSEHRMSACARLGISVRSARVYQATDKGPLERWFRTLDEQLLAALPGYKGPDVYRRGKEAEQEAFYFLSELEAIIRQWTANYHRQPHAGLCVPEVPGLEISPLEIRESADQRPKSTPSAIAGP
jgi:hypothetical protein